MYICWVVAACCAAVLAAAADGTVRICSASTGRVQRKLLLNGPCRALAWSPDGSLILAGGGDGSGRKCGAFWILTAVDLTVEFEGRDCRGWIRAAAWSPDSTAFALAANDSKLATAKQASIHNVAFTVSARCMTNLAIMLVFTAYNPLSQARSVRHYRLHNSKQCTIGTLLAELRACVRFMQSSALDGGMVRHSVLDGSIFTVEAQLKPLSVATATYDMHEQYSWRAWIVAFRFLTAERSAVLVAHLYTL
eukprot:5691-Heterococcus_DN1.PRE.2